MKELITDIMIEAPPERVWRVLTDFAAYSQWNPFIRRIVGELRNGAPLEVDLQPPGGRSMTFRPTVRKVEPNREFRWLGHLLIPGLFDGEHVFELEPVGSGATRFLHREAFRGILVPFLWKMLDTRTREGFHGMNRALKARVEAGPV